MRLGAVLFLALLFATQPARAEADVEQAVALFRADRFAEASKLLHALANDPQRATADRSRAQYYLARSLHALGLVQAAQLELVAVLERGPDDPYFRYALSGLLSIAHQTGDPAPLLGVVDQVEPADQPPRAQPTLHYLQGLAAWHREDPVRANEQLSLVPDDNDLHPRARYLQGLIHLEHGKQKSAASAFQDVVRAEPRGDRGEREQLAELQAMATLRLGRLYDDLGDLDQAEGFYAQVERGSRAWSEALEAMARIDLAQREPTSALRRSAAVAWQTVPASALRVSSVPRVAEILHAQALRALCRPTDAELVLRRLEARALPSWTALAAATASHRDATGAWRDPSLAWTTWIDGADSDDPPLDQDVVSTLLERDELVAHVARLARLGDEQTRIRADSQLWREQVGQDLVSDLEVEVARIQGEAGIDLLEASAALEAELGTLLQLAEAERRGLATDQPCEPPTPGPQGSDPDAWGQGTTEDEASWTWPYTGEIWVDEL